ncbi:ATP-dependent Clp protease proteolytic subunit [Rhabdochromatium marinum]|uniref:ATP-dependent Clp protease proteolytic subunit n=1 Tax=Rhabdochromatium marinum TaxID=48729 RepID=UPI001905964A|nr:ATP-dependent Clp protease proteolytic subunit [Rhabdochromatium marinum]MBK1649987.1 hypothetical protein [Rhabdochromatium marinum]
MNIGSDAVQLYCLGEKKFAHPNSQFMIHAIKWKLTNYTPDKLEKISTSVEILQSNVNDIYSDCFGGSFEYIKPYISNSEDLYLDAEDAERKGIVDEISDKQPTPKKCI